MHEVFVKRSEVAPKHQELIMCIENCIPVEPQAHIAMGNTREALEKCGLALIRAIGAFQIGPWYTSLWQEHGLSIDTGLLIPPQALKVWQLIELMEQGARLDGIELPSTGWDQKGKKGITDVRAQVALRFQDKRRKWRDTLPKEHNGYTTLELKDWLSEGYWTDYLFRTMGIQWPR